MAHNTKIDYANLSQIEQWVVKLQARRGDQVILGTGFFINIPSAIDGPAYDVILTAGFFLIDDRGRRTTDVKVLLSTDPSDSISIDPSQIRIAKAYEDDNECAQANYGAILITRSDWKARRGFGYSLCLADMEVIPGTLHLHGYRPTTIPGKPDVTVGDCLLSIVTGSPTGEVLRYSNVTQQGNGGGVVWAAYGGREVAVAVHTRGSYGHESSGTRITFSLLSEVFSWVNVGRYDTLLRASPKPKQQSPKADRGLYLSFPENDLNGHVKLGSGTSLQVLPVHVSSSNDGADDQFAIRVDEYWAVFNTQTTRIEKSAVFKDGCLFKTRPPKIGDPIPRDLKIFQLVAEAGGQKVQLTMRDEMIDENDERKMESSDVSLLKYPVKGKDPSFSTFCFESLAEATPDPPHSSDVHYVNLSNMEEWIVKLQFKDGQSPKNGSGFYINIPSSTDGPAYDVILTAGHNLINEDGKLMTDMRLLRSGEPDHFLSIHPSQYRIAKAYEADRTCHEADYGAILIERQDWKARRGMGYTLRLAEMDVIPGKLRVHGYRGPTVAGKPDVSIGDCMPSPKKGNSAGEQLKYDVTTQPGLSGSAVWAGYDGEAMVVAVHNRGSKYGMPAGSRITLTLLQEVFSWANVGQEDLKLRAFPKRRQVTPNTEKGLFLSFLEGSNFARVKLGSGSTIRSLPVHVSASDVKFPDDRYAFKLNDGWVFFDAKKRSVERRQLLREGCLVLFKRIWYDKANPRKIRSFDLVIKLRDHTSTMQMRMQDTQIRPDCEESFEVSLLDYPPIGSPGFTDFCFESPPDITVKRLTAIALHRVIIYCDDSFAMNRESRYLTQCELVQRIARVATKISPDGFVELRFMNAPGNPGKLSASQVDAEMKKVSLASGSKLGTALRSKVLQPLVYNVLADSRGQNLEQPLLVCAITCGRPEGESPTTFKDAIAECRKVVTQNGYEPTAVRFMVCQIGNDNGAGEFLDGLTADMDLKDIVYCTTDQSDERFSDLRINERSLEVWLVTMLTSVLMQSVMQGISKIVH